MIKELLCKYLDYLPRYWSIEIYINYTWFEIFLIDLDGNEIRNTPAWQDIREVINYARKQEKMEEIKKWA